MSRVRALLRRFFQHGDLQLDRLRERWTCRPMLLTSHEPHALALAGVRLVLQVFLFEQPKLGPVRSARDAPLAHKRDGE